MNYDTQINHTSPGYARVKINGYGDVAQKVSH